MSKGLSFAISMTVAVYVRAAFLFILAITAFVMRDVAGLQAQKTPAYIFAFGFTWISA
jgi:uncharacterized membrane protein